MSEFVIDQQLVKDCHQLGVLEESHILLMNNALVPWLIIVPEVSAIEFYQIDRAQQQIILQQINLLSQFIKQEFKTDKLNVATIGNIVKQMHIHIVGRTKNDYCWPNVVWGASKNKPYTQAEIIKFKEKLWSFLQSNSIDFNMPIH